MTFPDDLARWSTWAWWALRLAWWAAYEWLPWKISTWRYNYHWDQGLRHDRRIHHRAWRHYRRTGELFVTDR